MADGLLLVIDRRETTVTWEAGALRVTQPDGRFERYPAELLGSVVVHGGALVSCEVWRHLAEREVAAVLLPGRGSGAVAWLGAGLVPALRLRRAQHAATSEQSLAVARHLLAGKLAAQGALLAALSRPEPPPVFTVLPDATAAAARIAHARENLPTAADGDALMGLEGQAALAWYGWLQQALPPHWRFHGRNRRPPRDPLNALLSLGYTLLGAEVRAAVAAAGFDPALGFLHQPRAGREALVLDCLEPLRPGVDAFALALLENPLTPDHFYANEVDGCRLTKAGRELFYPAWAAARREWPRPGEAEEGGEPTLAAACRRVAREVGRLLGVSGEEPGDG